MRLDVEMVAEAFEVLIEVQDADARVPGGSGDRQVGEREAMGSARNWRKYSRSRRGSKTPP